MGWVRAARTGLIDLLILRRKDYGTRNYFLGESSGPYFWGKKKHTPGILGSQERRTGVSALHERNMVSWGSASNACGLSQG